MGYVEFTYETLNGEGTKINIDLTSDHPSLNPYVAKERYVSQLAELRNGDAYKIAVETGNDPLHLLDIVNSTHVLLSEVEYLIEQWELKLSQQETSAQDAVVASTEEERAIVSSRGLGETTVVMCDDVTTSGQPCKNRAMAGDTKCGPHRDKYNRMTVIPEQLGFADYVVAGTGSREAQTDSPQKKQRLIDVLRRELEDLVKIHGARLVVVSGMAEGFDKALALVALNMGIRLHVVIPSKDYGDYYWRRNSLTRTNKIEEFNSIISRAEARTYVVEDILKPTGKGVYYYANTNTLSWEKGGRHINMVRNDHMVEIADSFLVYRPNSPGTRDCVASIKAAELPYQEIVL